MKKLTALILTALMILSSLPMMVFAGRFEDVQNEKWYSDGISFCAANEYMTGTSETVFDRNAALTRAMFVTILAKIDGANLTEYEGKISFVDVKTDGWYTSAIEWAYQNKLASGIGSNKDGEPVFGYKNPVTREQMALFLYAYAEYVNSKGYEIVVPDIPIEYSASVDTALRADLSVFKDADRVHSWAKDAMEWAVACDLFSGIGEDLLDPRGNCTRAQAAVLLRAFVLNFLCDCDHEWSEATCTEMSACSKCDLKSATELGHDFGEHLCTESLKCSRCDVMSEITEHDLVAATCTTPSICKKCRFEASPAKGHDANPATCTEPSICNICKAQVAPAKGHSTNNGICSDCGAEVFKRPLDKLNYYLRQNGEFVDSGNWQFSHVETVEKLKYTFKVKTHGSYVILVLNIYDYSENTEYQMITKIGYPSDQVHYIESEGVYYTYDYSMGVLFYISGSYLPANVNSNGDFTIYEEPTQNRDAAISLTRAMFAELLYVSEYLIQENANMSLSDFGFNMTSFYQ